MTRIQKIVSIIIMLTVLVSTTVFAADYTFTLTVNPESTTAKLGDTISIDIGIADIDQTTQGINAIQGDIVFDEDLFESVDLIGTGNNWSVSYNNVEGSDLKGRFVLSNMNSVKDSQVVARLVAKIKTNATATTGKITLKDVYSSYGSSQTDKTTKIVTVNINSSGADDDKNNNNTIIDNNSSNTVIPTPSSPSKTDTSKTTQSTSTNKTVLPKTGIVSWIGIIIVAAIIVAIIEFIKYKRLIK